jgi:hypothetical protein
LAFGQLSPMTVSSSHMSFRAMFVRLTPFNIEHEFELSTTTF